MANECAGDLADLSNIGPVNQISRRQLISYKMRLQRGSLKYRHAISSGRRKVSSQTSAYVVADFLGGPLHRIGFRLHIGKVGGGSIIGHLGEGLTATKLLARFLIDQPVVHVDPIAKTASILIRVFDQGLGPGDGGEVKPVTAGPSVAVCEG